MLCGIGGFSDFYKLRWLEAILSWQKPQEGCFGTPGELPFGPGWEQKVVGISMFQARGGKDAVVVGTQKEICSTQVQAHTQTTHRRKWAENFGAKPTGEEAVVSEDVGPLHLRPCTDSSFLRVFPEHLPWPHTGLGSR